MGTTITIIIILLVIVGIIALVAVSGYNGFVKSRNQIQESWRQIDVELNRRYELIPNLVETVRAYAAHERNTLEDVTRLRSQAQQLAQSEGSMPSQQRADVEAALSGAVRNLIVSVEAYPDLKSNQNFLELQRQLTETEDRIAAGRRFYNANVRVYNTKVESVPTNIIANIFKFEKATYFEVNEQAVRQAPNVSFGEIAYRGDAEQGQQQPPQLPASSAGSANDLPNPQAYQQPQQYQPQPQYQQQPPQYQQPQYQQPQPQQPPYQQQPPQQPPYQQQPPQYQQQPPQYQQPPQGGGYSAPQSAPAWPPQPNQNPYPGGQNPGQQGGQEHDEQQGGQPPAGGGYQPPRT